MQNPALIMDDTSAGGSHTDISTLTTLPGYDGTWESPRRLADGPDDDAYKTPVFSISGSHSWHAYLTNNSGITSAGNGTQAVPRPSLQVASDTESPVVCTSWQDSPNLACFDNAPSDGTSNKGCQTNTGHATWELFNDKTEQTTFTVCSDDKMDKGQTANTLQDNNIDMERCHCKDGTCPIHEGGLQVKPMLSVDIMCRICWDGEDKEPCVRPCRCTGSAAHVHPSCLERWLSYTKTSSCEVCRYRFRIIKKMKTVSQWTLSAISRKQRRQFWIMLLFLIIVTPPFVCGLSLCAEKIREYLSSPLYAWKTAGIMSLAIVSMILYTMVVTYCGCRLIYIWKAWRSSNQTVIIQQHQTSVLTRNTVSSNSGGVAAQDGSTTHEISPDGFF